MFKLMKLITLAYQMASDHSWVDVFSHIRAPAIGFRWRELVDCCWSLEGRAGSGVEPEGRDRWWWSDRSNLRPFGFPHWDPNHHGRWSTSPSKWRIHEGIPLCAWRKSLLPAHVVGMRVESQTLPPIVLWLLDVGRRAKHHQLAVRSGPPGRNDSLEDLLLSSVVSFQHWQSSSPPTSHCSFLPSPPSYAALLRSASSAPLTPSRPAPPPWSPARECWKGPVLSALPASHRASGWSPSTAVEKPWSHHFLPAPSLPWDCFWGTPQKNIKKTTKYSVDSPSSGFPSFPIGKIQTYQNISKNHLQQIQASSRSFNSFTRVVASTSTGPSITSPLRPCRVTRTAAMARQALGAGPWCRGPKGWGSPAFWPRLHMSKTNLMSKNGQIGSRAEHWDCHCMMVSNHGGGWWR